MKQPGSTDSRIQRPGSRHKDVGEKRRGRKEDLIGNLRSISIAELEDDLSLYREIFKAILRDYGFADAVRALIYSAHEKASGVGRTILEEDEMNDYMAIYRVALLSARLSGAKDDISAAVNAVVNAAYEEAANQCTELGHRKKILDMRSE